MTMGLNDEENLSRDFFSGFIRMHILFHTCQRPFYGQELKEELEGHGYSLSFGTLYPILGKLNASGYLTREDRKVGGRIRKYYSITDKGKKALKEARARARELVKEIFEGDI
jgi:DNA-binding PadR family transcriptional regulator